MAYSLEALASNRRRSGRSDTRLVELLTPGYVAEKLVDATPAESSKVKSLIHQKLPLVKIKEIKKVQNNFLEAMYLLKKKEYISRYKRVDEKLLIHSTGKTSVKSIITNNFDWRRVSRGKFGLGTSFSDDAQYANRYANKDIGTERAFIITQVLVSHQIGGSSGMVIPPSKYDTTTGNNKVFVKYCDNEILPQYVVYYNSAGLPGGSYTTSQFDDDPSDVYDLEPFGTYYDPYDNDLEDYGGYYDPYEAYNDLEDYGGYYDPNEAYNDLEDYGGYYDPNDVDGDLDYY